MVDLKIIALVVAALVGGVAVRSYYAPKVAVVKAVEKARNVEKKIAASDNQVSATYQKELEDGKIELQNANDRLRAELDRVRRSKPKTMPVNTTCDRRLDEAEIYAELSESNRAKLIDALERFGNRQYELAADADADAAQVEGLQQQLKTRTEETK